MYRLCFLCFVTWYAHTFRTTWLKCVLHICPHQCLRKRNNEYFIIIYYLVLRMEIAQGKILIAQPFLNDGNFKRTVILLSEHNDYGTMGFVVNRPMHLRLKDVLPDFPDLLNPLYYGGPVAPNQLFFIHRAADRIKNSMPITKKYCWGGDFEDVIRLVRSRELSGKEVKFFVGYAGWEPHQLDTEMEQKAWFLADTDYHNIMLDNASEIWGNELRRMGSNYAVFSNFPDDPSLN